MSTINLSKTTINLSKGETVNLSKSTDGLKEVMIGLGWDAVEKTKAPAGFLAKLFGMAPASYDIDCDAWLAILKDDKLIKQSDVVYFGNKRYNVGKDCVILHHGDNLTGGGVGDDEQITVHLDRIPSKYNSIIIGVTIYRGAQRNQSFGSIKNTFIRVVDSRDNFEICRFNQSDMAEDKCAITFIAGKLYKENNEWKFEAIGKGTMDESIGIAVNKYV